MPHIKSNGRPAGEPLVWLTSMGLAVGLAMVFLLLYVIVTNGASVFWPKRIYAWTISDKGQTEVLWGELAKSQKKRVGEGDEIQIYTGNRDAFSASFRYVDRAVITTEELPKGVIAIERLEYGNAIGLPVRLALADGTTIPAGDDAFRGRLRSLVSEIANRRDVISVLEKERIGENSRDIYRQDLSVRRGKRTGDLAMVADAEAEIARLKLSYDELSATATALRKLQSADTLIIGLCNHKERSIVIGQIVDFHFPNELGLAARIGTTIENVWKFLSENPREANTEGGIFPAIVGTFVMTILMSVVVTPFGVLAAIYLREYARQGPFVRAVRIAVNNLAGVPSIVFGVFGLGFFVYGVGGAIDSMFFFDRLPTPTYGTGGIIWAAATLALMTVPVVIVATEESISAVGRGAREGSLALGASKWQTIQRIVLPAAVPGILTGLILAMARGAGEVAPLMLVGVVKLAPSLPIDGTWNDTDLIPFLHLDQKFMHLGFHIYDLGFQSPDSDAAIPMVYATTFFLICLVLVLNLTAILMRERLRKKFATGAF